MQWKFPLNETSFKKDPMKNRLIAQGDTISSEAIRGWKKAKFSFENEQLVLRFKNGKIVHFDRE